MALRAQDVLITLKIALSDEVMTYAELAEGLSISVSQAHAAVENAIESGLLFSSRKVNRIGLIEFLLHGIKYVFPAKLGQVLRGMPTSHSARPLKKLFSGADTIVWPEPKGKARGESLEPIHRSVPFAASMDAKLYECLVLVDAIRVGRARERRVAEQKLKEMLK